jgi:hypothetical protein
MNTITTHNQNNSKEELTVVNSYIRDAVVFIPAIISTLAWINGNINAVELVEISAIGVSAAMIIQTYMNRMR